jgi:hypothetical protein
MTIDTKVRVKLGRYEGKTGVIRAVCNLSEYLVDFSFSKDRFQGYWINGTQLEETSNVSS